MRSRFLAVVVFGLIFGSFSPSTFSGKGVGLGIGVSIF
jgi:hypothetical protein